MDSTIPHYMRSGSPSPNTGPRQALSVGEETLARDLKALKINFVREYRFYPKRKWQFDFAFPDHKIGVEVEGGTSRGNSRHSRGDGFEEDCRKYNAAASIGWCVLRFTTRMVTKGEAFREIEKTLEEVIV